MGGHTEESGGTVQVIAAYPMPCNTAFVTVASSRGTSVVPMPKCRKLSYRSTD